MKKILVFGIAILLFSACQKQIPEITSTGETGIVAEKSNSKIYVCHKEGNGTSHMINISINAWPAHQAHGDIRLDDEDDDGYVPNNPCDFGQMGDCDDHNASVNPGVPEICDNGIDENCNGLIDENCIPSVTICDQSWMSENLDVSTYRNGDPIPQVTDFSAWAGLTTGAWCYYENNSANGPVYGKLYNWYAVNDPRGLAPEGWRIPGISDWNKLIKCIDAEADTTCFYCIQSTWAGGALKETGTAHWLSPNTGATNSTGFTAVPGGYLNHTNGACYSLGLSGSYWSSEELNTGNAWLYDMYNVATYIYKYYYSKKSGMSVRCIRE